MIKKLEDLTPEQDQLTEIVFREYDGVLDSLPRKPNMDAIRNWLAVVYSLYDVPLPDRVEVVDSPFAAFKLEAQLTGKSDNYLDWCGVSEAWWVAELDYYGRIGVADEEEISQTIAFREFQRSAWDTVLLDECAIVIALPKSVKRDEAGNLHCQTGPCIEWGDGEKDFSWHGVWVPERVITSPRSYTREEYTAVTQTEVRRAIGEAAGWDHVVSILGAKSTNQWTDPTTGLAYELFATEGSREKWIRKQSPVLQTEAQPFYFDPVHEDLKTAQAARKWQAVELTPEQCERDPVLTYGVET